MKSTIMIVEDNDTVRTSLRDWLSTTFSECSFLAAKSGEEAVALALANHPDIVLMDIGLQQMDGIEATRRIKFLLPKVHVVMLTVHEAHEYKADAISAGASAYVTKRKMHKELIPILTTLLSEPKAG